MKIVTIVGARPQFIKCAPVSKMLRKSFKEILIHTGQHYDNNMSDIFFNELGIPKPDYNLEVGENTQVSQLSRMLERIESVIRIEKPELVITYGDTTSTLAGAMCAAKMDIKCAHIEAGLRSFNKIMPEEINRIVSDHISNFLFAPSQTAVKNLEREGIIEKVFNTGDVMFDATLINYEFAKQNSRILKQLGLSNGKYYFLTLHRPYNVDNIEILSEILYALGSINQTIIFPVHPRTKARILDFNLNVEKNIITIEPIGYLDSLVLQKNAIKIITDSGGVQKEAYFLNVPCITLRSETEWVETVEIGANLLVKNRSRSEIFESIIKEQKWEEKSCYGNGTASENILNILEKNFL